MQRYINIQILAKKKSNLADQNMKTTYTKTNNQRESEKQKKISDKKTQNSSCML